MERKTVFFPYETLDYKTAEARLNALGAEGWRPVRTRLGRWLVLEREGTLPLRCCVDVNRQADRDYIGMCAEAGWTWVCCDRHMDLYVSQPGENPIPIQTDPGMEERRLFRQVVLRAWFSLLLSVGIVLACWWFQTHTGENRLALSVFLTSGLGLSGLAVAAAAWAAALIQLFGMTAYARHCRRTVEEGGSIPTPTQRGAVGRSLLSMAPGLLAILWAVVLIAAMFVQGSGPSPWTAVDGGALEHRPVVRGADLGLETGAEETYLYRSGGSLLVDYETCCQKDNRVLGTTYRCRGKGTARLMAALLLVDFRDGRLLRYAAEELPMERAELGFDGAWLWRSGAGRQLLLFREGDTVAWVLADADLTAPQSLTALRERLGPDAEE